MVTQVAVSGDTPINVWLFVLIRDVGASLLLLLAAAVHTRCGSTFWPAKSYAYRLVLVGFCGIWGSQFLGAIAIKSVGAVTFQAMQPSQPVVTFFLSVLLGSEFVLLFPRRRPRLSDEAVAASLYDYRLCLYGWLKVFGILLTVSGAVLLVVMKASSTTHAPATRTNSKSTDGVMGAIALFLQVLLGSLYSIIQKKILTDHPAIVVCAWGYVAGCLLIILTIVICAPLTSFFPGTKSIIPDVLSFDFWHVPAASVLPLVYAIVMMSAVGYALMSWVNQKTSAFFVTLFYPVSAVMAELFAYLFVGEYIHYYVWLSSAMIAFGLYSVLWAKKKEAEQLEEISRSIQ